jgi:glycosyltransferase involved in cell wall biosynthesis
MKSAVCLVVRNEEHDIAEWIAYHALLGFNTQIIFDNCSSDGTERVIRAAEGLYDIRFHQWTNRSTESQMAAYEAACEAYKLEFDWIAFLDSDEFLVLTGQEKINTLLARFERWSGIAINWAIYGSSGHVDRPGDLILEAFTHRANTDFFATRHVKPIIRPSFASRCLNPHCFDLSGHINGSYCNTLGKTMEWFPVSDGNGIIPGLSRDFADYSIARVNHYFTRSRAHWHAKLKRGYPSDVAIRTMDEFDEYDRNEIEDPIATPYGPALRAAVAQIHDRRGRIRGAAPRANELLYIHPSESEESLMLLSRSEPLNL